jgi:hypothetical protein
MAASDGDDGAEARARASLQAMLPRLGDPPHALLGVAEGAGPEPLRAAFLRLTMQFHPTKYARFAPEVVRLANEVFLTIKRAYDQLAAVPRPIPAAGSGAAGSVRASGTTPPPRRPSQPVATARGGTHIGPPPAPRPPVHAASPAPSRPPASPPRRAATPPIAPMAPRARTPALGVAIRSRTPPTGAPAPAPTAPDAELGAALELAHRGRWSDARQAFHRLALAHPHDPRYRAHMHWARAREALDGGRADEARAEVQRALTLDPGLTAARRILDELPPAPGGDLPGRTARR